MSNEVNGFSAKKNRNSIDLSRKGVIDESIQNLITFINELDEFVTTSSCSGRIIVVSKDEGDSTKKGCKWITTNHTIVNPDVILEKIIQFKTMKNMVLKFEPFILHVQCKDLRSAKHMQNCALAGGFRNSGFILGRNGNLTLAVRGTHGLEVPISDEHGLIVSHEYIKFVLNKANIKMMENERRIEKFSKEVYAMNKGIMENRDLKDDIT